MFANEEDGTEASCFVSRNESSFKHFKECRTPLLHSGCPVWQALCPAAPAAYICLIAIT